MANNMIWSSTLKLICRSELSLQEPSNVLRVDNSRIISFIEPTIHRPFMRDFTKEHYTGQFFV